MENKIKRQVLDSLSTVHTKVSIHYTLVIPLESLTHFYPVDLPFSAWQSVCGECM